MERPTITRSNLIAVFSIRPFLILWLAQLFSQVGFNMLIFILGVFVYEHTHSNTAVSILFFTSGVPAAIGGILAGVYVDRLNKKLVLFVSTVARVLLILFVVLSHFHLWLLYALIVLISAVSQFFVPAEAALIPRIVPQNLLLPANSLFTLTFYTAIIGGFVIGGPLLVHFGHIQLMFLLVALFTLTAFLITFLPDIEKDTKFENKASWKSLHKDLVSGISFIMNTVRVKQAILLMTIAQMVISIFLTLGPGFADSVLGIAVTDASLYILGPAAVGLIIGAIITGMIGMRFNKRQLIYFGLTSSGILLLLIGILAHLKSLAFLEKFFGISYSILPVSMVCFALLGFANALIDISCNTVIQESTPDEIRGRVYGVLASLVSGVALLPVIISGVIADVIGIDKMIFVLGIMLLTMSVVAPRILNRTLKKTQLS